MGKHCFVWIYYYSVSCVKLSDSHIYWCAHTYMIVVKRRNFVSHGSPVDNNYMRLCWFKAISNHILFTPCGRLSSQKYFAKIDIQQSWIPKNIVHIMGIVFWSKAQSYFFPSILRSLQIWYNTHLPIKKKIKTKEEANIPPFKAENKMTVVKDCNLINNLSIF